MRVVVADKDKSDGRKAMVIWNALGVRNQTQPGGREKRKRNVFTSFHFTAHTHTVHTRY